VTFAPPPAPPPGSKAKVVDTPPKPGSLADVPPTLAQLVDSTVNQKNGARMGRVVDVLIDAEGVPQALVVDLSDSLAGDKRQVAANWPDLHMQLRNKVMTLDFLLTLAPTQAKPLRHVAISVKERRELSDGEDVWERFAREKRFCGAHGWGYTIYTEAEVPRIVARRARRVALWAALSDIASDAEDAQRISELMPFGTSPVSLDTLMLRAARELGCAPDDAYRFLSVAAMLGHVRIDFSFEVNKSSQVIFK